MMLAGLPGCPCQLAAPEVAHPAIVESKHVEHRFVSYFALRHSPRQTDRPRQLGGVAKMISVVAITGRREKVHSLNALDRLFGEQIAGEHVVEFLLVFRFQHFESAAQALDAPCLP